MNKKKEFDVGHSSTPCIQNAVYKVQVLNIHANLNTYINNDKCVVSHKKEYIQKTCKKQNSNKTYIKFM